MDAVSEIKSRISIEELVSQYLPLKKAGRHFKALCPFHQERTPSFYVSPERQLAYCFGCHKGGDHFKFIQEMEGFDFRSALEFLAEKTGVTLPKKHPLELREKSHRDRLFQIHEYAADFFQKNLLESASGKKVLAYLQKRGFQQQTIKKARLGFAPDEESLYSFLLQKDFTKDEILSSGLVLARDTESQNIVNRFFKRLMFPIADLAGRICAFGGRSLKEGDQPKYLNSPETAIFHKSALLYGLDTARTELRKRNEVILVEGYMDVLASHQAGFLHAVACSGTALTEEQLRILQRFTSHLIFAFDRDTAGKLATERAIELALEKNFSIKIAVWRGDEKDPDECIRRNPEDFREALTQAKSVFPYLISSLQERYDIQKIPEKKNLIDALLPFFSRIVSPIELDEWIKWCSKELDVSLASLYEEVKRFQRKQNTSIKLVDLRPSVSPKSFSLEEYILGLLLIYKDIIGEASRLLKSEYFEEIELQNIYRSLTTQYNLTSEEQDRVKLLSMFVETNHGDMTREAVSDEVQQACRAFARKRLDMKKKEFIVKLKGAKPEDHKVLFEAYQELLEREARS